MVHSTSGITYDCPEKEVMDMSPLSLNESFFFKETSICFPEVF